VLWIALITARITCFCLCCVIQIPMVFILFYFCFFFASDFAENLIENNKDSFVCLFVRSFIHSLTEGTVFLLFVCFFHWCCSTMDFNRFIISLLYSPLFVSQLISTRILLEGDGCYHKKWSRRIWTFISSLGNMQKGIKVNHTNN